jgi:hypothetical protein
MLNVFEILSALLIFHAPADPHLRVFERICTYLRILNYMKILKVGKVLMKSRIAAWMS